MTDAQALSPWLAPFAVLGLLLVGAYGAALLHLVLGRSLLPLTSRLGSRTFRPPWTRVVLTPVVDAALCMLRPRISTERDDGLLLALAPALYLGVAAGALSVVPLAEGVVVADLPAGIVVFGALEVLVIVAVFLRGWAPNAPLPLLGGYRFVALGLSYALVSMFVLIAAALPAESLALPAIVDDQATAWNAVRQPLSVPLWLLVVLGVTLTGPLDVADAADLAGGTSAETSGRAALLWQVGRGANLTAFSAMGAAVLLGGWHGPVLPGWVWMASKTLLLMAVVVWLGHRLARRPVEKTVRALWIGALPLSFFHLVLAGLEARP